MCYSKVLVNVNMAPWLHQRRNQSVRFDGQSILRIWKSKYFWNVSSMKTWARLLLSTLMNKKYTRLDICNKLMICMTAYIYIYNIETLIFNCEQVGWSRHNLMFQMRHVFWKYSKWSSPNWCDHHHFYVLLFLISRNSIIPYRVSNADLVEGHGDECIRKNQKWGITNIEKHPILLQTHIYIYIYI